MISSTLAIGAGCYWGTEKYIIKDFQKRYPNSIKNAKVGFMSPNKYAMKNPSYHQVCSGTTTHIEVLMIELNSPSKLLFEELIKFFFMFHDPTTKNKQGYDIGTQYGSVIFYTDNEQMTIATKVKNELQQLVNTNKIRGYINETIETIIVKYTDFYEAHEEHQEYLMKHPNGYCNHRFRFQQWPNIVQTPQDVKTTTTKTLKSKTNKGRRLFFGRMYPFKNWLLFGRRRTTTPATVNV